MAQALAVTATAGAALSSCSGSEGGEGACPPILTFEGTDYSQAQSGQKLQSAEKLGTGTLPGCADLNDEPVDGARVRVWRLKGVSPDVAVGASYADTLWLYVSSDVDDVCGVKYTKCE